MIRVTVLSFCMAISLVCYAQIENSEFVIEKLRNQIEMRDSVLTRIKKNNVKIDSLNSQIADFNSLVETMEMRYADIKQTNDEYELLTSPDTLVFYASFDSYDVPQCLKTHIEIVTRIGELRLLIDNVEKKIIILNQQLQNLGDGELKHVIREGTRKDVDIIDLKIREIKKMDLNSLSKEQYEFFKPGLTERYNSFLVYGK